MIIKQICMSIMAIGLAACNMDSNEKFTDVDCVPEETPKYDNITVKLINSEGIAYKDTVIEQIEKRRTIFIPCRDYIYRANYYSKDSVLITSSRIKLTSAGKRWDFQSDRQDEIVIQYEYSSKDKAKAEEYKINKTLNSSWIDKEQTGIVENVNEVWMHPFRSNQFAFTEVAPFPRVKFPLYIGKSWIEQLSIQNGWGDWENSSGNMYYEIMDKRPLKTKYGNIEDCWKVESFAKYPFGKSHHDFYFNEKLGFVRMQYKNYEGQYLNIELEEVFDH